MHTRMVDAHLAGQSSRQIAAWMKPSVSPSAVNRYIRTHVKPIMENAESMSKLLGSHKVENIILTSESKNLPVSTPNAAVLHMVARSSILGSRILTARDNRIALQQELAQRLVQIAEERGREYETCEGCRQPRESHPVMRADGTAACATYIDVPGGTTGFLVRKYKPNGTEYVVDTGLVEAISERAKTIAIESGQWQETTGGNVSIQIVCPTAGADGKMEEVKVRFSTEGAIDALDGTVEEIGLKQLG